MNTPVVCSWCRSLLSQLNKPIRRASISEDANASHGLCADCMEDAYSGVKPNPPAPISDAEALALDMNLTSTAN